MNVQRKVTTIVCVIAGLAILISAAWAQRVVRIVNGRPVTEPASNSATKEPAVDPNAVQPIDPTPEEHERISGLIEQLGDDRLTSRDRAMSELAGFEARALGQVREAKSHDDDEIANRCYLLEEVILSRQGELFLAARRLNLTIVELNSYLQNEDVTPLLSILRGRAQAGMVPLWARVLGRLAARPQLFPTAVLCREIEGTTGYGQAVSKAARMPEAAQAAANLVLLLALLPPGDPADTVEALTQLRFAMGERGMESALSAARDFHGVYEPSALLAARTGRPDPNAEDQDGAAEVRNALALNMLKSCTAEQLDAAGLPALDAMSPLLLSAWLGVLKRSGLDARIEAAMVSVMAAGADTRRISITAGAYASVAPVQDVIEVFDSLPLEAQLAVLDAMWLNPRQARTWQPFLVKLLGHKGAGVRYAAAQSLGQYHAASTAAALLDAALSDETVAPPALASLQRMPDLLNAAAIARLGAKLGDAGLLTRPLIAEILVSVGSSDSLKPLLDGWKTVLPRNELPLAIKVLALTPATPAGAFAASRIADNTTADLDGFLVQMLDNADLEMVRTLLKLDVEPGFKLLREIALDENDSSRLEAMKTLAVAGRDGDLVQDWLKRLAGEIKDPLLARVGEAIALSQDPAAEEFKRATLQQGSKAGFIWIVVRSVMNGRCQVITRDQMLEVLFETPESARTWAGSFELISGPLPPRVASNLATALAFAQGGNLFNQPGIALMLADARIDILKIMYGDTEKPTPRDQMQMFTTAALGEPARAKAIIEATEPAADGSNFVALTLSRAWLGLLPGEESSRVRNGLSSDPTNMFGAAMRLERARQGNAIALRTLLDAFGPDSIRFQRGETAGMQLVEQQWGSPYMDVQGVAAAAHAPAGSAQWLASGSLTALFKDAPPTEWRNWWASRRGLLEFDQAAGKFAFTELP